MQKSSKESIGKMRSAMDTLSNTHSLIG